MSEGQNMLLALAEYGNDSDVETQGEQAQEELQSTLQDIQSLDVQQKLKNIKQQQNELQKLSQNLQYGSDYEDSPRSQDIGNGLNLPYHISSDKQQTIEIKTSNQERPQNNNKVETLIISLQSNSNSSQENKQQNLNLISGQGGQHRNGNNQLQNCQLPNTQNSQDKYRNLLPKEILYKPKKVNSKHNMKHSQEQVINGIQKIKHGRDFKQTLKSVRQYKNPSFFQSMTDTLGIKQYGTQYTQEQFDLQDIEKLPKIDEIYSTVRKELAEAQQKKQSEKKFDLAPPKASVHFQGHQQVQLGNQYFQKQVHAKQQQNLNSQSNKGLSTFQANLQNIQQQRQQQMLDKNRTINSQDLQAKQQQIKKQVQSIQSGQGQKRKSGEQDNSRIKKSRY